jgi:hypothetical protein
MQMLTCIHALFDATTTTEYAILDLIVLNADLILLLLNKLIVELKLALLYRVANPNCAITRTRK